MNSRLKVRIDPDQLDAENLKDMIASPGWKLYAERLALTRAKELEGLATVKSWESCCYKQGFVAALELAWQIPANLLKEIRTRSERKEEVNALDA